uniref:C2 domain-containing protein n=1 Tax=Macrostomum lignano TaxID=282301 RepID=A0A1I8FCI0_9PLAT
RSSLRVDYCSCVEGMLHSWRRSSEHNAAYFATSSAPATSAVFCPRRGDVRLLHQCGVWAGKNSARMARNDRLSLPDQWPMRSDLNSAVAQKLLELLRPPVGQVLASLGERLERHSVEVHIALLFLQKVLIPAAVELSGGAWQHWLTNAKGTVVDVRADDGDSELDYEVDEPDGDFGDPSLEGHHDQHHRRRAGGHHRRRRNVGSAARRKTRSKLSNKPQDFQWRPANCRAAKHQSGVPGHRCYNQMKQTRIKKSTNSPYWGETFFFNFPRVTRRPNGELVECGVS